MSFRAMPQDVPPLSGSRAVAQIDRLGSPTMIVVDRLREVALRRVEKKELIPLPPLLEFVPRRQLRREGD